LTSSLLQVKHLQQLKTLLGDAMELRWVKPPPSQRKNTASVRDLDLAVRFHVQHSDAPSEAVSPTRGRSATRCQITASSSSPPQLSETSPSPQSTPSKPFPPASLTARRNSQIKMTLLSCMRKHVSATQNNTRQLPQNISSLDDLFTHQSCAAWDSVKLADLPERPSQIPAGVAGSLSATPQRCGSAAHALTTPSPSIRHRNFSTAALPSAQLTPQSIWGASAANTHVSPSQFAARSAAPQSGQVAGKQASDSLLHSGQVVGGVTRVLFPEPETPHTCKDRSPAPVSACKLPCHTPGKRKRDISPPSTVVDRSPSVSHLRTPVATPLATPKKYQRSASKAQRTPVLACVGLTPTPSVTPVHTPVKGVQASPAVRRQLMAMSTPSRYSNRLPIVQVRTPKATPKAKTRVSASSTPINDVNGIHAHCAVVTPGSAQSIMPSPAKKTSPAVNFSRRAQQHASPRPTKVANAETFYSSPSKPSIVARPVLLPFKVIHPVSGSSSPGKSCGSPTSKSIEHTSDAACLAASIMDDDMAELLASNSRRAAQCKIAQDPKNVKRAMEKVYRLSFTLKCLAKGVCDGACLVVASPHPVAYVCHLTIN
jgi:hypothetical protein